MILFLCIKTAQSPILCLKMRFFFSFNPLTLHWGNQTPPAGPVMELCFFLVACPGPLAMTQRETEMMQLSSVFTARQEIMLTMSVLLENARLTIYIEREIYLVTIQFGYNREKINCR